LLERESVDLEVTNESLDYRLEGGKVLHVRTPEVCKVTLALVLPQECLDQVVVDGVKLRPVPAAVLRREGIVTPCLAMESQGCDPVDK